MTLVEIQRCYPSPFKGGVLIVDDYGHWQGARAAVDEYFRGEQVHGVRTPLFQIVDYTGRTAVK